jgi:hypothetical protein
LIYVNRNTLEVGKKDGMLNMFQNPDKVNYFVFRLINKRKTSNIVRILRNSNKKITKTPYFH